MCRADWLLVVPIGVWTWVSPRWEGGPWQCLACPSCMSVCVCGLSVSLCVCLCLCFGCLSVCFACLLACLPAYLSVSVCVCLRLSVSVYVCLCLSVYVCLCHSVRLCRPSKTAFPKGSFGQWFVRTQKGQPCCWHSHLHRWFPRPQRLSANRVIQSFECVCVCVGVYVSVCVHMRLSVCVCVTRALSLSLSSVRTCARRCVCARALTAVPRLAPRRSLPTLLDAVCQVECGGSCHLFGPQGPFLEEHGLFLLHRSLHTIAATSLWPCLQLADVARSYCFGFARLCLALLPL